MQSTLWTAAVVAVASVAGVAHADEQEKVQVSQKQPFGQYLTDEDGHALYLFTADKKTASTCYDACAQAWPPVVTSGTPEAGAGITKGMLGTTRRHDGKMQVTYHGHPLYYFVKDNGPDSTAGQDRHGFGGEWYLVSPSGGKVKGKG
jgi:predicted lipoprotein with Yx(FWY)xxD motif